VTVLGAPVTWARVSYRQQRWELLLVVLGTALATAAMLWFATELRSLAAAHPGCIDGDGTGCEAIAQQLDALRGTGQRLLYLSFVAPFGMGVLLGAPLVAREIDGGTAQLAWTLSRSRTGWLLRRIAFVGLLTIALLGALAMASELLAAALQPGADMGHDFTWIGRRGWLIVARGLGSLFIGLLVGALIGRVLPAILAAILVIGLAFTGVSILQDRWLAGEAEIARFGVNGPGDGLPAGSLMLDTGLQTPDGTSYTWEQARARGLEVTVIDEQGRQYASDADMRAGRVLGVDIEFFVPGGRYPEVVARDGAMALGLGAAGLGLAAVVVRRRRPV
jgi:hypothetical protein